MKKKDFVMEALTSLKEVKATHALYSAATGDERKSRLRDFKAEYRHLYKLCMSDAGKRCEVNGLQEALVNYGFLYTMANLETLDSLESAAAESIIQSRKRRQSALPEGIEEVTVTRATRRSRSHSVIEMEFASALRSLDD